jgi:hypothetical protein
MAGSATGKVSAEAPLVPGSAAQAGACALRAEAPIIGNVVCNGPWEILCSIEGELGEGAEVVGNVIAQEVTVRPHQRHHPRRAGKAAAERRRRG